MNVSLLLTYGVGPFCLIAFLYKLVRFFRLKQLEKSYFKNKVVLVTGASGGIGKAIAEELYPLGARLILCARNVDSLNKVKADLMKLPVKGKEPEVVDLDVSTGLDVVGPKIDAILAKFGHIDVLVNNAGISFRGQCFTTSIETYKRIMEVNFFGAVRLTNKVLESMFASNASSEPKREFSIMNIGSVQSYIGIPYRSAYCATKHALLAYADSLRAELYQHPNIHVLNAQPGYVNTQIAINALSTDGQKNDVNDDDHRNGYDPNFVARRVIRAILDKEDEVVIAPPIHRLAIMLRCLWPALFTRLMAKRAKAFSYEIDMKKCQ